jgi:hypothetical protein
MGPNTPSARSTSLGAISVVPSARLSRWVSFGMGADVRVGTAWIWKLAATVCAGVVCTWLLDSRPVALASRSQIGGHSASARLISPGKQNISVFASLPRMTYPRGALAQVQVTVKNGYSHSVFVLPVCGGDNPAVGVWTNNGRLVYPPALRFPPIPNTACRAGSGTPVAPGHSVRRSLYVILRGERLTPTATVQPFGEAVMTVAGPPLRVRLVPGRATRARIVTSPRVSAYVHRPRGAKGPALYVGWTSCHVAHRGLPSISGVKVWEPTWDFHLLPRPAGDCTRLLKWNALVGWPGFPVARIRYSAVQN